MGARHPSPRVACSTVVLLPPLGGGVQDVAAGSAGGPHPSFSHEFDARERALVEATDALRVRVRAVRRAMDSLARHLEAPVDEWTWLHEHAVELRLQLLERSVDLNGQIIDLNEAHSDWVLGGGFRAA